MASRLSTGITSHARNAEGVTEYTIEVRIQDEAPKQPPVVIRRRFREFHRLSMDLDAPGLPSRFADTAPASRILRLDAFLKLVCESHAPWGCPKAVVPRALLVFLGVENADFGDAPRLIVDIGTPTVPAQFASEIERVVAEVLEAAKSKDDEGGWKLIGSQSGFAWSARPAGPGVKANRLVRGSLRGAPPRLVLEMFMDHKGAKELEPGIKQCSEVAVLDKHTVVQYYLMYSIMMTAERDVLMVRHWRVLSSGQIVVAEFSVEEYPGAPKAGEGGKVRAELTCGGAVITPDANDPLSCHVCVINDMDPKLGTIPDWAQVKLNEITTAMLSNNMFNLVKALKNKKISVYVAKGPAVNANGSVQGAVAPAPAADAKEDSKALPGPDKGVWIAGAVAVVVASVMGALASELWRG